VEDADHRLHNADQIQQNDDREGDTYEPENKGHDDLLSCGDQNCMRLARFPALSFGNIRLGAAFAWRIARVEMAQDAIVAELRAEAASLVTASAAAELRIGPRLKSAPWMRKIGWSACSRRSALN
jgi:hypothetical protein